MKSPYTTLSLGSFDKAFKGVSRLADTDLSSSFFGSQQQSLSGLSEAAAAGALGQFRRLWLENHWCTRVAATLPNTLHLT